MAKSKGLNEVRIKFGMVMNSRLKTDANWAKEFDYYFHSETTKFGTDVTWTKTIK